MWTTVIRRIHDTVGNPNVENSISSRRRAVRFKELMCWFPELGKMRVLDLGGRPDFWRSAPVHPAHVTTLNLDDEHDFPESWLEHVVADACDIASLDICAGDYDLVVSNSLIEHVGGYNRRRELAQVVRAAAPAHWVQTPDRYFPIEPHYLGPGFQFLPIKMRAAIIRRWPVAHDRVYTTADALAQALTIDLISATELQHLFPESVIWHERFVGLSKSIVAIKGS
jgi:hypothetical protein